MRTLSRIAPAVCMAAVLLFSPRAEAWRGGGFGGFRGFGGFHQGFGGFRGQEFRERFGFRPGWGWGAAGVAAIPFFYDWDNAGYGDSQPEASSQYWYYCQDPAGYYPQVTQCSTAWQPVPAN